MNKKCRKCNEEKSIDLFVIRKDSIDGKANICKDCSNKYYKLNYNKYKETKKNYLNRNREKLYHQHKIWEQSNKDYRAEYKRNKRKSSADEQIKNRLRRRIKEILTTNKNKTCFEYTACSLEELKSHLQSTAIKNNYNDFDINNYDGTKYHIDHIVPCSAFNLSCSFHQKLCFNYENLQILKAEENLKKGKIYDCN